MSFEVFEKLEAKVQQAVETIGLLQMELEELKVKNQTLLAEMEQTSTHHGTLIQDNQQLQEQQRVWQERLQSLLGRMENI